jgi:large-conductance mechanosensitive channel
MVGHPANALAFFGIDKLIFGAICGAITFWFGGAWYEYLKEKNNNHAYFPFQKVVMPILPLIILSIIFYFMISSINSFASSFPASAENNPPTQLEDIVP